MSLFLTSLSRAGSSSSGSVGSVGSACTLCASFRALHVSASLGAAKKVAKPQVKKKTAIKKTTSGPRGTGGKGRRGGTDGAAARTNPFFRAPGAVKLEQLVPGKCEEQRVGEAFAWSKKIRELGTVPRGIARELTSQPTPRTILRPLSLSLFSSLESAASSPSSTPQMLTGGRGVGKSHLLLQCVSHALESGWIVLYIPRSIGLINSTSPYIYAPTLQTWAQRDISRVVARSLISQPALSSIPVLDLPADASLPRGSALELATYLANNPSCSPAVLAGGVQLLLASLAAQKNTPFLLAIDDAQALYMRSAYKDYDARPLQAWELSMPRSILSLLGAHKPQRGAILGALGLSSSEYAPSPALLRAIGQESLALSKRATVPLNAYSKVDETHEKHAREAGWKAVEVPKLGEKEAKGIWDVLRLEGAGWNVANDELFVAKLLESGGNARIFERSLTRTAV